MFALDTNTLVYFFKGKGRVAERLLAQPPGEIAIPAVCLYELHVGIRGSQARSRRQEQLENLLELVLVLPFDARCAEVAADLRVRLEHGGQAIGPLDTLIAATALAYRCTLVTHNTREFERVGGLATVDWF